MGIFSQFATRPVYNSHAGVLLAYSARSRRTDPSTPHRMPARAHGNRGPSMARWCKKSTYGQENLRARLSRLPPAATLAVCREIWFA